MNASDMARSAEIMACLISAENYIAEATVSGEPFEKLFDTVHSAADYIVRYLQRRCDDETYGQIVRLCAEIISSHPKNQILRAGSLEQ